MANPPVDAYAPGRVNLIGDHTDHSGGFVLPLALDRGTTVAFTPAPAAAGATQVTLTSSGERQPAVVPLDVHDPRQLEPAWARYVAGVMIELRAAGDRLTGGEGTVRTTLPIGAGLSSSAALTVAVALALGARGTPLDIAELCRRAEERASGIPCGIMDQLAATAGVEGCALLIDCTSLKVTAVPLPAGVEVVIVDSGERRTLVGSPYAARRADCERAASLIGPLRHAVRYDVERLADERLRRRARHVVTENVRVVAAAEALLAGDVATAGRLMNESHASLRDDFEVSTPALDRLVAQLAGTPGVYGARLTGAGFGGCAVALVAAGSEVAGWRALASAGARVRRLG